jgi:hypothetical protein
MPGDQVSLETWVLCLQAVLISVHEQTAFMPLMLAQQFSRII